MPSSSCSVMKAVLPREEASRRICICKQLHADNDVTSSAGKSREMKCGQMQDKWVRRYKIETVGKHKKINNKLAT